MLRITIRITILKQSYLVLKFLTANARTEMVVIGTMSIKYKYIVGTVSYLG